MPKLDLSGAPTETGEDRLGRVAEVHLGERGGLTQFGVILQTLWPGAASSDRHWHEEEDEFLLVLDGQATLVENAGETPLRPGEAAAWAKGVANAHTVVNHGATPLKILVAGWRAPRDVVHYPDRGGRAVIADGERRIEAGDAPGAADLPSGRLDLDALPVRTGSIYPPPLVAEVRGRTALRLGEAGGLTQFGVNIVTLPPGVASSMRHWHEQEDEFVMILDGECTMRTDAGMTPMRPGDCAAFPAGDRDAHTFVNRSDAPARFLVIGAKAPREVAHYPDRNLKVVIENGRAEFFHEDGRAFEGGS